MNNNFHIGTIRKEGKDQELFCVLEDFFNQPCQYKLDADGDISAFVYSNTEGKAVLEVTLTKQGRVTSIISQLSDQEEKVLEKLIKHAILDNKGEKIGQTICFFTGTVETYYRCRRFQIVPVPTHAPKSRTLADTPFLLQFTYPTSPNWRIDSMRRIAQEQHYINLLSLFLQTKIAVNPSATSPIWTCDFERHSTEQRFPLYSYEDFSFNIDVFSNISEYQQNIPIPAQDYYTGILAFRNAFITGQAELRIPDNLCESFEIVHNLGRKDRENFYRACHWLRQAQTQLPLSKSLSLIALITAIECLIEKKQCPACQQEQVIAIGRCEKCSEPIYKITEAFKNFIESLLPDVARDQKALSLLYHTRSSLVHGSEILLSDSHPWVHFIQNKRALEQYSIYDRAYILTKVTLYKWLYTKKHA